MRPFVNIKRKKDMTASTISTYKKSDNLLLHCIASFFTMFLLYFIDNGLSLFSELTRPGVWVGMAICSVVILFGQALVRELFLLKYNGQHKTKLTLLIGIPLGVILLYTVLFLLRY
jgi:hypothetical protein